MLLSRYSTGLVLSLACSLLMAPPTEAQMHAGSSIENAFDDAAPWVGFDAKTFVNPSLLAVRVATYPNSKYMVTAGNSLPAVALRQFVGHSWNLNPPIVVEEQFTLAAYDIELDDFNADGRPDLVVGRLLDVDIPMEDDANWTDNVLLAESAAPYFPDPLMLGNVIRLVPDVELETGIYGTSITGSYPYTGPALSYFLAHRRTFGIELGDVNGDGFTDIIAVGANYGIRYFQAVTEDPDGAGPMPLQWTGAFEHVTTYVGPDFSYLGSPGSFAGFNNFRSAELADLDGDGDLDLFVSRSLEQPGLTCGAALAGSSDLVFYNLTTLSGHEPALGSDPNSTLAGGPLYMSQQCLDRPSPPPIRYRLVDATTHVPDGAGTWTDITPHKSTFEAALADLDRDGDLDVVTSSPTGLNSAWLNNGNGEFGSLNSPAMSNDGQPAYVFPAITPSWQGVSNCALWSTNLILAGQGQSPLTPPSGKAYEIILPGSLINGCTGVSIAKADNNYRVDVAFSNRNDIEEVCVDFANNFECHSGWIPPFPNPGCDPGFEGDPGYYLNDTTKAPDTYDLLFFNATTTPGTLAFDTCVELLLEVNDGTGYGEMIDIDGDRKVDWLDANFANFEQGGSNRVYWGKAPSGLFGCALMSAPAPEVSGGSTLAIRFDASVAGAEYHVMLTAGPNPPAVGRLQGRASLKQLAGNFDLRVPSEMGGVGVLDARGHAETTLDPTWAREWFGRAWVTVLAVEGGEVFRITQSVRLEGTMPSRSPAAN